MYPKCGSIDNVQKVFNKMPFQNVVTWKAMILGNVKRGQEQKALELFRHMQQEGVQPDSITFMGVWNACASMGVLEDGRSVHDQVIQSGSKFDVFVGVAWWTCMQNVGALKTLWECSTRCHLKMWSLEAPWYWDMWNVGKGRRHYHYLSKCNRKMCSWTLLPGAVFQFCRNGQPSCQPH